MFVSGETDKIKDLVVSRTYQFRRDSVPVYQVPIRHAGFDVNDVDGGVFCKGAAGV